jgi:LacI family transcriptional regulator
MAKKKISIKDIARNLDISITTVSFILNGKAKEKRISDELIARVERYIQETGYRPSHLAQSLRLGKSRVIVFMVEDISNHFFASIARLIEEKAFENGYKIIYCSTENNPEKAKELIGTFKVRNVDGFVITPTPDLESTISELLEEDFAVLLFDRWMPEVDCSYVIVENEQSAFDATEHLIRQGCRQIGLIHVESDQMQMKLRLAGYRNAIGKYGLSEHVLFIPFHNYSENEEIDKIIGFLKSHPELDAVFFSTNYLAFEGLRAIQQLGKRIPEDLAVVSFDDHYFFSLFQPNITGIEQPLHKIADRLMEGMLELLRENGDKKTVIREILPTVLHPRGSSIRTGKK